MSARHLLADVRFALRLLRRSPGYTATLFFLLVGGIGATTAMFSIVESLLLKPLPYDHPEELETLCSVSDLEPGACVTTSLPDFLDWKAQSSSFVSMAAFQRQDVTLTAPGAKPERFSGLIATGELFEVFKARSLRGRLLGPDDDRRGGPKVAMISASMWRDRFASDPAVVGGVVRFDGDDYTVVGVAPDGFSFGGADLSRVDVWAPMAAAYPPSMYAASLRDRGRRSLRAVGRRRNDVSLASAQAELSAIAVRLARLAPDTDTGLGVVVQDLHDEMVRKARGGVLVLLAAVGLVFLVVCPNVASLLLTRGAARRGEIAIRAALGATRSRLVRQLLTETLVIFLASALGGLLLARGILDHLVAILPLGGARALGMAMDPAAFAVCLFASLAFGLVFGFAPALISSRVEPEVVLKQIASRAGSSRSHHLVRGALVVTQVALAFALLAGAGLALRAFTSLDDTDPGFGVEDRVTAVLSLSPTRYPDPASRDFVRRLVALLEAQPGVISAAVNTTLPFGDSDSSSSFEIEGRPPFAAGANANVGRNVVTDHYFATMGIPLLRGRGFTGSDRQGARRVIVVTRTFADRYFPGEDAIGRRLDLGESQDSGQDWREIVGVVGDVHRFDLSTPPAPEVYEPVDQRRGALGFYLVVHSTRGSELIHELSGFVQQIDADEAVSATTTVHQMVASSLDLQRSLTLLLALFAGAALILATLGVFGLVSYSTAQRTREIGIRMALGSSPEAVVALVVRSGLTLLGLGLCLGFVAALLVGRLLASRLADVPAFDVAVYGGVPLLLLVAGAVACLVPALRAARTPPAAALRYE